jgi:hypothetical protein
VATSGALKGLAGLGVAMVAAVGFGAVAGFGPLAGPVPPEKVTDPREMIARGLQAVLDSSAVHVDATVSGTILGSLVGRGSGARIALDGTTVAADALPRQARTASRIEIPSLDVALETTSVWDALWYRDKPSDPWLRASVGGVAADAGVDINPLTLVDRLRGYLGRPDLRPTVTDAPCPGEAAVACRHVVLDAGRDPAALLEVMLPEEAGSDLPPVSTTISFDAEVATLRPVLVVIDMASGDGSVNLVVTLEASRWDDPSIVIEEPPAGS